MNEIKICLCGDHTENKDGVCETCKFLKDEYGEIEFDCVKKKTVLKED